MKPIILITGGSRGIGAATAVTKIQAAGGEAFTIKADVSNEAEVVALFKALDQKSGALTALVNNVGILEPHEQI